MTSEFANDLPAPLVPADVDLRVYPYMELDVARLRDSDLAAISTGEQFKAAVLLWCASWHQVPAASLPDDDRLLKRYSGTGTAWNRVKEVALRGFVKCSDGRLYHPVIAEKALKAFGKRRTASVKGKAGADARWGLTDSPRNAPAIARAMPKPMPNDGNGTERKVAKHGTERNREAEKPKTSSSPGGEGPFEEFWQAYPRKVGKTAAKKTWERVKPSEDLGARMIAAVKKQQRCEQWTRDGGQFIPYPATWLNQGRWDDVLDAPATATLNARACSSCGATGSLVETQAGPLCMPCYRA